VHYANAILQQFQAHAISFLMQFFTCLPTVPILKSTIDRARGMTVLGATVGVVVMLQSGMMDPQLARLSVMAGALIGAFERLVVALLNCASDLC
jgi:hypothetical protein